MKLLRAFLFLKWRIALNTLRGTRGRKSGLSAWMDTLFPVFAALLLIPLTLGGLVFGGVFGYAMVHTAAKGPALLLAIRVGLAMMIVMMAVMPWVQGSGTGGGNLSRLLLLPVPSRLLHRMSLWSTAADPWFVLTVMPLLGLPVGALLAGRPLFAGMALLAGWTGALSLLALLHLFQTLSQIGLKNRRRGELFMLLAILGISSLSMLPAMLGPSGTEEAIEGLENSGTGPAWWLNLPGELYVRVLQAGQDGRGGVAGFITAQGVLAAALMNASRRVHASLLRTPETGPRRASGSAIAWRRWPFLGAAASAAASLHVRLWLRCVQGKIALILGVVMAPVMTFVVRRVLEKELPGASLLHGDGMACAVMVFPLMVWGNLWCNQFAADGAGVTLRHLLPVTLHDWLAGRMAGAAVLMGGTALAGALATALFLEPQHPWLAVLLALLSGASALLLLAPAGLALSALLPKKVDIGKMGQQNQPHAGGAMLGLLVTVLAAGIPAALAALGSLAGPLWLAPGLLLAWLLVCVILFRALRAPVVRLVERRSEAIQTAIRG